LGMVGTHGRASLRNHSHTRLLVKHGLIRGSHLARPPAIDKPREQLFLYVPTLQESLSTSLKFERIASANPTPLLHGGIDAYVNLIVLSRCAQNAWIIG